MKNAQSNISKPRKAIARINQPSLDDGIAPTLIIMLKIYEASLNQILFSSCELNGKRSE